MTTPHIIAAILIFLFIILAYLFSKPVSTSKNMGYLSVSEVKKIKKKMNQTQAAITKPPEVQWRDLNRRQRRHVLRKGNSHKMKKSTVMSKEKMRIVEARDFMKENSISNKFFDGK